MVKLKSTWLRGGAARISQYLGHGEIRRGKCQDAVSTATVVLKQASLPQGYEGLGHLRSSRKINMSGKLWGSQEKLKNPDSYVGFSSTSPPTQKCRKQTNRGCAAHMQESQVQMFLSQHTICVPYCQWSLRSQTRCLTQEPPSATLDTGQVHPTPSAAPTIKGPSAESNRKAYDVSIVVITRA